MDEADLERSFAELGTVRPSHARTLQGRIRSYQDRWADAWDLFEQASKAIPDSDESIPNLVRQFVLEAYRFQNTLMEAPIDPATTFPPLALPWVYDLVLEEYPEVRYVLLVRKRTEARLRLHLGEFEHADKLFRELRTENQVNYELTSAEASLGLAACHESEGDLDAAMRELENASLVTLLIDKLLNQAVLSARLVASYGYLGETRRSDDWKAFLQNLACAEPSRDAFARFALRIEQRCSELDRLVAL